MSIRSLQEDIYARLYKIIGDANMLLQKVPDEQYTRYRAEASFLRALAYFELVIGTSLRSHEIINCWKIQTSSITP